MAGPGSRVRHDSGVDTDSDGSTTAMSLGSPPHRPHALANNQVDEGIIDAPNVPDLPPQEVKVLEISRPQFMEMCPVVDEDCGPPQPKNRVLPNEDETCGIVPTREVGLARGSYHTETSPNFHFALKHSVTTAKTHSATVVPKTLACDQPTTSSSSSASSTLPQTSNATDDFYGQCGAAGGKLRTCASRGRLLRERASRMYPKKPPRKSDESALREAAAANDIARCEQLLKSGARADASDSCRRTALHFAATVRSGAALVNLLLRYGADPSAQDVAGNTPLHLAICINNEPVIHELLQHGSDLSAVDRSGRNPLQLATSKLQLILLKTTCEPQNSSRHAVSERLRNETLKTIACLQEYLQQREDAKSLAASAVLFNSFQERILASTSSKQFTSDVSDLLSSLEHLQLL